VREDEIQSTRTGYVTTEAHRYVIDLAAGDRIDVAATSLGASRGPYAIVGDDVPHDLGLALYMPGGTLGGGVLGAASCPAQNDGYLNDETTKTRTGVASVVGQAVVYVKTDFVVPASAVDYRITIAINGHGGAGRVAFHGQVSFTEIISPHCRLLS
jgi:hypothetical protein